MWSTSNIYWGSGCCPRWLFSFPVVKRNHCGSITPMWSDKWWWSVCDQPDHMFIWTCAYRSDLQGNLLTRTFRRRETQILIRRIDIQHRKSTRTTPSEDIRFKKYALCQIFLQIKVVKNSISYKKVSGRLCLSPPTPWGEVGSFKDCHFQNIKCKKKAKWIHFRTRCYQKYALYQKPLQIKVVQDSISYKKVCECICPSPPRVELGGFKYCQFLYFIIFQRKQYLVPLGGR